MLNKQNKISKLLSKYYNSLNNYDVYLTGYNVLTEMLSNKINGKVFKISPRVPESTPDNKLEEITTDLEDVEELMELLDDDT